MNTRNRRRYNIVRYYINNNGSLRQVAKKYNISPTTLWRWVKWFRSGGQNALDRESLRRPWNKINVETELKTAFIKEFEPSITLTGARQLLNDQGIIISKNAIWAIWRNYGLTSNSNIPANHMEVFSLSSKIPSSLLDEGRSLINMFGKIPFPEYRQKARNLRLKLEKNGLRYSALKLGITELIALTWMGRVQDQIDLVRHIKQWLPAKGDVLIKYMLTVGEGIACAQTMRMEDARRCIQFGYSILTRNSITAPDLWRELANLNQHIGEYARAGNIVQKHIHKRIRRLDANVKAVMSMDHALLLATAGKYNKCEQVLENIDRPGQMVDSMALMVRAQCGFAMGSVQKAQEYARLAIQKAKKDQVSALLNVASIVFASITAALGDIQKAKRTIDLLNPLLRKTGMMKDLGIRELISRNSARESRLLKIKKNVHPVYRMIMIMKEADRQRSIILLRKACYYAKTHGFSGIFYRNLVFFPGLVRVASKKARSFDLPPLFYSLPGVSNFNSVFRINYLGPVQIKHRSFIKAKLSPKDQAFVVFLTRRHQQRIPLSDIYQFFWPNSSAAGQNLTHLLVRVRKALTISPYSLFLQDKDLICRCTFISDYDEFENSIVQARALERIGQDQLAQKEYCNAFILFRGEPFPAMYDAFSEQERLHILFTFEEIARHFIEKYVNIAGSPRHPVRKALTIILNIAPHLSDCVNRKKHYN